MRGNRYNATQTQPEPTKPSINVSKNPFSILVSSDSEQNEEESYDETPIEEPSKPEPQVFIPKPVQPKKSVWSAISFGKNEVVNVKFKNDHPAPVAKTTTKVPKIILNPKIPQTIANSKSKPDIFDFYIDNPIFTKMIAKYRPEPNWNERNEGKTNPPPKQAYFKMDSDMLYNYVQKLFDTDDYNKLTFIITNIDLVRRSMMMTYRKKTSEISQQFIEELLSTTITEHVPAFLSNTITSPNPTESYYYFDNEVWCTVNRCILPFGKKLIYSSEMFLILLKFIKYYLNTLFMVDRENVYDESKNSERGKIEKLQREYTGKKMTDDDYITLKNTLQQYEETAKAEAYEKSKTDSKNAHTVRRDLKRFMTESSVFDIENNFKVRMSWRLLTLDITQCGIENEFQDVITDKNIFNIFYIDEYSLTDYANTMKSIRNVFWNQYPDYKHKSMTKEQYELLLKTQMYIYQLQLIMMYKSQYIDNTNVSKKEFVRVDAGMWRILSIIWNNTEYNPETAKTVLQDIYVQETKVGLLQLLLNKFADKTRAGSSIFADNSYMKYLMASYDADECTSLVMTNISSNSPMYAGMFIRYLCEVFGNAVETPITNYIEDCFSSKRTNETFWTILFNAYLCGEYLKNIPFDEAFKIISSKCNSESSRFHCGKHATLILREMNTQRKIVENGYKNILLEHFNSIDLSQINIPGVKYQVKDSINILESL